MKSALFIIVGTFLLCCSSLTSLAEDLGSPGASPAPKWTADLSAYHRKPIDSERPFDPFGQQSGIFFSDNGSLVGYFVTRSARPTLSIRNKTGQYNLRAILLDPATGAAQAMNEFHAAKSGTALVPIVGGGLALKAGATLALYSPGLKLISSSAVPQAERFEQQYLKTSTDRTVLWFVRDQFTGGASRSTVERLDARSLQRLSSLDSDIALGPEFTASAEAVARSYPQTATSVIVGDGHAWKPLLKPNAGSCVGEPAFVSNGRLFVAGCGHFILVDTAGNVLMDDISHAGWKFENAPVASRNGDFAAVSLVKAEGAAYETKSNTRIVVYDLRRKQRAYEVEVSRVPTCAYKFALSPDGSLLAVMTGSLVKVYEVPGPAAN